MSWSRLAEDIAGNHPGRFMTDAYNEAMDATTKNAIAVLKKMSSGGWSLESLKEMDYPYATRHGSPRGLARWNLINKHEGNIYYGWSAKRKGDSIEIDNDAYYALFVIEGHRGRWSKKRGRRVGGMFPRGGTQNSFLDRVEANLYKRFEKNFERAMKKQERKKR